MINITNDTDVTTAWPAAPILGTTEQPGASRLAESLARIGVTLTAQRVELFRTDSPETVELAGWWTALGMNPSIDLAMCQPVEISWFPWSLGCIRPSEYVLVPNAGTLPLSPKSKRTIADIGMATVLHLPLFVAAGDIEPLGALCCYWATEISGIDQTALDRAFDMGRDALLDC